MLTFDSLRQTRPYIRMMRLKKSAGLTGKWKDIDHVFTYIASGEADFVIDGVSYSLQTGDAILIPPYQTHLIMSRGQKMLVQYIFHFDFFENPQRVHLIHRDVLEQDPSLEDLPECEQLMEGEVMIAEFTEKEKLLLMRLYMDMRNEFKESEPEPESDLILSDYAQIILTMFLRSQKTHGAVCQLRDEKRTKAWGHIESAINYIQCGNLIEKVDNETIADQIGVSPNYLTRVFRECVGMSLHRYITALRMEKAQQLLLSGKFNVTEAASLTGFSSVFVFTKAFKKQLGVCPSEFIDQTVNIESESIDVITYRNSA